MPAFISAQLDTIEQYGARPPTCPWQAFRDPVVRDVLTAYRATQVGADAHLAAYRATNPAHLMWVGVNYYHRALCRVRADVRRMRRERDS